MLCTSSLFRKVSFCQQLLSAYFNVNNNNNNDDDDDDDDDKEKK